MNEVTKIAAATTTGTTLGAVNSLAVGDVGFLFIETAVAIGLGGFIFWGGMVGLGGYGVFRFFRDAFGNNSPYEGA